MNEDIERALHAYRDGELRGLAAWRMRRRIRRDPALRREVEEIDRLGELVRSAEAGRRAPDLLAGLETRLAAVDAEFEAGRRVPPDPEMEPWAPRRGGRRWLAPAPAAALAAAALAAIAFLLLEPGGGGGSSPGSGDIRSLDTRGHAVMVSSDEQATIVWILDS